MASLKSLIPLFLCAAIASGPPALCQSAAQPPQQKARPVPVPSDPLAKSPFDISGAPARLFRMVPADEMSSADNELFAKAEPAIRRQAQNLDLGYDKGAWTHAQLDCPAFPNHLLLRFTRTGGKRDESVFSASIPRSGSGRVRLIPILRRGYSPFSPAPSNSVTIAVFNRIVAEEKLQKKFNWAEVGECYAALAGADPEIVPADRQGENILDPAAPLLEVAENGQAIIHIETDRPRPIEWEMIFDRHGRLIHANAATGTHGIKAAPLGSSEPHPVPLASGEPAPRTIPPPQ